MNLATATLFAAQCAASVAPGTLLSVAQTESGFNPYAIHVNHSSVVVQPRSTNEAVALASSLLSHGANIDLGIMQINSTNLAPLGLSVAAAFDPCSSMRAGAVLLTEAYLHCHADSGDEQACIRQAASVYNTGNSIAGFYNGYVHKVELAASVVVPEISVNVPEAARKFPSQVPRCEAHGPGDDWHVQSDSVCETPSLAWHTQASNREGVHQ